MSARAVGAKISMIREYRADDLNAVIELIGRSVREIACLDYDPDQIEAWAPALPDRQAWVQRLATETVLVAESESRLAGIARLEQSGHVDLLYVHPQFQRRGIAAMLMETMIRLARKRGCRRLGTEASLTARPFFAAQGFVVVAERVVERRGVRLRNLRMERIIVP